MSRTRIYSVALQQSRAPGTSMVSVFHIFEPRKQFKILSIFYDMLIQDVAGLPLPWRNNTTQVLTTQVGSLATPIASHFMNFTGGATIVDNAMTVTITEPGQYFFDSFFISQDCYISHTSFNRDALITYTHQASYVIEIEILGMI